jgi:tetratricopeptide (TPR) repeat protein
LPRTLPKPVALAIAVVGIPLLAFSSWWSFRAAQADFLQTSANAARAGRAVEITPGSAAAHARAAYLYAAVDPFSNKQDVELKAAAALNPRDSASLMELGLKAEMDGDNGRAEKYLLAAAEINHMFKPAWSLANFYARTGQTEKFWPWIGKCIDLLEHRNGEPWTFDPNAVFELCWRVTNDAAAIDRVIPSKAFILDNYLAYLVPTNRIDAALHTASRLYPLAQPRDVVFFCALAETLVQQKRRDDESIKRTASGALSSAGPGAGEIVDEWRACFGADRARFRLAISAPGGSLRTLFADHAQHEFRFERR